MPRLILPLAFLMVLSLPAQSQEREIYTRVAEQGSASPAASIADVAWLQGVWIGEGIGGGAAMEDWLPPAGDTMVGTFVQETPEGGIMFTEHMYLMEEEGSLAVKLKHFNADLTGWEDKDGMVTFRLLALEDCAAYFQALTYRCDGDRGLLVAVRMRSDKPEPQELVFRFRRAGSAEEVAYCPDAVTTVDINACYAEVLQRADDRRAAYLAAATDRESERPALVEKILASNAAFIAYRNAECGAVLEDWSDGTIRGVMTLSCQITLTDARTHTIWQNWLTYMDSTPPLLPEPGLTQ